MTASPDLPGVVFVNYHSEALIRPRVERLRRAGHIVRVADNSGTYPDPEGRVGTGRNIGFGAACNMAVDALPPAVTSICLHNPDVTIAETAIAHLAVRLANLPDGGACAPALRVGYRTRMNGFHYPGLLREAYLSLRGSARSGHARRPAGSDGAARPLTGRGRRYASAALMVVDRQAFESLGGFDERFFLYGEDLDLWHRLGTGGYATEFVPTIVAHHDAASGSDATRGTRELLRWIGVELFTEKHAYGSWRLMRRVHRPLLGRLVGVPPALLENVADMWSRAATPEETSASVRLLAASGDL